MWRMHVIWMKKIDFRRLSFFVDFVDPPVLTSRLECLVGCFGCTICFGFVFVVDGDPLCILAGPGGRWLALARTRVH